jgi:lactoylglutathione lyase
MWFNKLLPEQSLQQDVAMHIEHVAIWTRNLEGLMAFYETYFGGKSSPKYINPAHQFESYFLSFEGGARLELMHMPSVPLTLNDPHAQFTGLIHVALSVGSPESVDALTGRLQTDGFAVVSLPRRTGDDYYESCVLDPDGNRVEITA